MSKISAPSTFSGYFPFYVLQTAVIHPKEALRGSFSSVKALVFMTHEMKIWVIRFAIKMNKCVPASNMMSALSVFSGTFSSIAKIQAGALGKQQANLQAQS